MTHRIGLPISNTRTKNDAKGVPMTSRVLTIYDTYGSPVANVMRPWADKRLFESAQGNFGEWKASTMQAALDYCDQIVKAVNCHDDLVRTLREIASVDPANYDDALAFSKIIRKTAANVLKRCGEDGGGQ